MDEIDILRDQLGRLLAAHVDRTCLRAAEAGNWPETLWAAVEEFGLRTALLPETSGGAGLSWSDAAGIFHLIGRSAAPVPLGEALIAAWLLDRASIPAPDGPLTFADGTALRLRGDHFEGTLHDVAFAGHAPVVTIVGGGAAPMVCLIDAAAAAQPLTNTAREPRSRIDMDGVAPLACAPIPEPVPRLDELGAMLRASQIAGALRRILEMTIEHANTRQQFGRPIGRFQAIQHLSARLAAEVAAAEVVSGSAWRALDAGDAAFAAAVARIRCSDAARLGAAIAHQVHGAIGVTDEHMLHYFTGRLWLWRLEFGSEKQWSQRLGQSALARDGGDLWRLLTREISV